MKLLEICQQLPDEDVSEFQRFTSKWINYVQSNTNSNSISETDWNQFFSQTNPVAGVDRGAMQDRIKQKDGYRETNERRSFVSNWDETILPIIKDIINPDSENRIEKIKHVRDTIRSIIIQGGGRNTKAAINRMLVTFCPDKLIRIPNEDNTKEFIDLLKPFSDMEKPLTKEEDWIDNSCHIMEFLKQQLGESIKKRTLWDIYTRLKDSDYRNNMDNEKGNSNMLEEYISLLKTNKNLILTGAPGTGKTYMARAIADAMSAEVEFVQFHPSYDYTDFVEGLRPMNDKNGNINFERRDGIFKEFCKKAMYSHRLFDELYDEIAKDLIRGKLNFDTNNYHYVVNNDGKITINNINYSISSKQKKGLNKEKIRAVFDYFLNAPEDWSSKATKEGFNNIIEKSEIEGKYVEFYISPIVKELLKRARKKNIQPRKDFVFIIDEINRGEISKIFGELFFSIDPSYRGIVGRVNTQYQNMIEDDDIFKEGFYVPENVYIIGTMNDIDRSVESMDFAMRRRFTWKEVTPDETGYMLDKLDCAAEAKATMKRLNTAIEKTEGLSAAYMIGPAYFLRLGKNGGDFNKLWKMNIEPLLKEYLRGFRKAKETLDKFSKAYFNQIDED